MVDDSKGGYGNPPKAHRFKPGQSGNPKGRPKGTKNLKTDLLEELAEMITVNEGGKRKKISKQRAMVKNLVAKAINGDTKATETLIRMLAKILGFEEQDQPATLPRDDLQIIDRFLSNHKANEANPNGED
jgi:hypothetical protein